VHKVRHHPALPYAQMGAFMVALRERAGFAPRALEFAILTGMRTEPVIEARWPEVDLAQKVWTVPPERAKRKNQNWVPHRVALSAAALKVLATVDSRERGGDFIFPGGRPGQPLSNGAMLELLKEMDWKDEKGNRITTHGFRATLRTWAAECRDFPDALVKAALGRTVGTKVDAAYQRGDFFEKRKRLMAAWADFCTRAPAGNKVVSISSGRR
jgi:integrase